MTTVSRHASDSWKRALIICNHRYTGTDRLLNHFEDNAKKLHAKLRSIGFIVERHMNVQGYIMNIVNAFQGTIEKNDLVFVYFFGLSCHIEDKNYLLPIRDDANGMDIDFEDNANNAQRIVHRLIEETPASAFVFILDCFRPYELKSDVTFNCKQLY